jgi:hypothetical protein
MGVMAGERVGVFFSEEDLTAGLVGYASRSCDGYDPDSAFELMRNIVLYAVGFPAKASPAPAPDPGRGLVIPQ